MYCTSATTQEQAKHTSLGYQTFWCPACRRTYNERTGTPFNHLTVPTDVVFLVVLWRLRYKLSLRDLAEMFLDRGFVFTHETVRDWEARFAPLLIADGRAAHAVPEFAQLSLNPLVAPARILAGEAHDRRHQVCGEGRPPTTLTPEGPLAAHQLTMPAQHGRRCDEQALGCQAYCTVRVRAPSYLALE